MTQPPMDSGQPDPNAPDPFPAAPPISGDAAAGLAPHRATLDLVLGILGLVLCQVLAIPAYLMSSTDLVAMDTGRMDPSGRSTTQVAKILGIVGLVLLALNVVVLIGMAVWLIRR